jgi:hypothetical protein
MGVVLRLHVHARIRDRPADQIRDLLCVHSGSDLKANVPARKPRSARGEGAIMVHQTRMNTAPE